MTSHRRAAEAGAWITAADKPPIRLFDPLVTRQPTISIRRGWGLPPVVVPAVDDRANH